jgi:hypothetical protein
MEPDLIGGDRPPHDGHVDAVVEQVLHHEPPDRTDPAVDDEVIGAQHVGQAAPDQHVAGRGACLCADPLACQRRIVEPAEREMVGTAVTSANVER